MLHCYTSKAVNDKGQSQHHWEAKRAIVYTVAPVDSTGAQVASLGAEDRKYPSTSAVSEVQSSDFRMLPVS